MTGKIITGTVFVVLASTSAFCEEPGPSAAPSPPPVLAQSQPAGVIEAATPAPTPIPTPALSPSATPGVAQAAPTPSPSVESSPAVSSASPGAVPTPASTFSSSLLGGKEPELNDEERAGVQITDAWRQRSYQSSGPDAAFDRKTARYRPDNIACSDDRSSHLSSDAGQP